MGNPQPRRAGVTIGITNNFHLGSFDKSPSRAIPLFFRRASSSATLLLAAASSFFCSLATGGCSALLSRVSETTFLSFSLLSALSSRITLGGATYSCTAASAGLEVVVFPIEVEGDDSDGEVTIPATVMVIKSRMFRPHPPPLVISKAHPTTPVVPPPVDTGTPPATSTWSNRITGVKSPGVCPGSRLEEPTWYIMMKTWFRLPHASKGCENDSGESLVSAWTRP